MDEFIVLLVIAIIILAILVAFGTPLAEWAGTTIPGTERTKELASFSLGRIGFTEGEVERTIKFGSFTLGQTQTESLKKMPSLGVCQGLLCSDKKAFEIRVNEEILNGLRSAKIRFDMGETNLQGNLVIKWNDKIFFDTVANLNRYEITIEPKNVKKTNVLEISARAPWYFLGQTVYNLKDMEVIAEYGPEKFFSFEIFPNELEAWDKGVLNFYTTSGQQGELVMKLNGKEIYRKTKPKHLESIEFEYSDIANILKIGDNILSLKSDDVFLIDDLRFDIYLTISDIAKQRVFEVTSDDMNLLKTGEGRISFYVEKEFKRGIFSIKLNDNDLNVLTIKSGRNEVTFASEDVKEGSNSLVFSGTGSWDISNVNVTIIY
jgi:hypothetical protein